MSPAYVLSREARPHSGPVELAALAALYAVYEVARGFGGENWVAARDHTADIVALEQRLSLFVERDVQAAAHAIGGIPALLGFLYALAVGVALARVLPRRGLRIAAAFYPGRDAARHRGDRNHFFFDAAAGAVVIVAGWWVAGRLGASRRLSVRRAAR